MADQESFDPTIMKKKKKKKPTLDPDTLEEKPPAAKTEEQSEDLPGGDENLETIDDFGKKKKKKKKVLALVDDEATKETEKQDGDAAGVGGDQDEDEEIDFSKKKKKAKTKKPIDEPMDAADGEVMGDSGEPDYTYDALLERVYNIMREKNPDMMSGDKKKFVMRPPRIARVGTKKTAFVNFADICKLLRRQPKHLLAFLLAELGTSGSVDGNNQLIIKGRFQQKHIENVLRKYIKEYVTCHTCKSAETNLQKDTRLFFLQCETCGSRCSVASIKSGFHAITTKRARIRAAAPQ